MVGKTISHDSILDKIGGGGVGVLDLAEDTKPVSAHHRMGFSRIQYTCESVR